MARGLTTLALMIAVTAVFSTLFVLTGVRSFDHFGQFGAGAIFGARHLSILPNKGCGE